MTPARINVAVVRPPPTERPIRYAANTAATPPANDTSGSTSPSTPAGPYAITTVAPKPAPAATPSRYGIRERVAEDALVRRSREREHPADERAEHHTREAQLPDDRLLRGVQGRRDAQEGHAGERGAEDLADADRHRPDEQADEHGSQQRGERDERPRDADARRCDHWKTVLAGRAHVERARFT